jgi:hypothetical protein
MSSPELDGLIVEHLADLDRAAARIGGIEAAVYAAMGKRAQEWAKQYGWVSDFDYPEGGWPKRTPPWVAPPEWRTADTPVDDNKFDGKFLLDHRNSEDCFSLTRLCGVGVDQVGFWFTRPDSMKPRQWRQAFHRLAEFVRDTRFVVDEEPSFFLPFTIEASTLAQALRDEDIDAALGPFEAALDFLLDAKPSFDQALQHLKSLGGLGTPVALTACSAGS